MEGTVVADYQPTAAAWATGYGAHTVRAKMIEADRASLAARASSRSREAFRKVALLGEPSGHTMRAMLSVAAPRDRGASSASAAGPAAGGASTASAAITDDHWWPMECE